MKYYTKGSQQWKQGQESLPVTDIVRMYESGYRGCWRDDNSMADLLDAQAIPEIEDAAHQFKWADHAKNELVAPFLNVDRLYPRCWPAKAQERGDCVSHGQRNADLTAHVGDILGGLPDEITGRIEGIVEDVSPAGRLDGIFSTEAYYWHRGYNGDGWDCSTSARVSQTLSGLVVRKPYADLGIDLSEYSGRLAGTYGSKSPPENIVAMTKQHVVRNVARVNSFEGLRDALAQGAGIQSCGGEGFSSTRDENGISEPRGGWSHSFALVGTDDRPVVIEKYGEPIVWCINSWGRNWIGGGKRILGTMWDILDGMWGCRWSTIKRRLILAMSGVTGWMRKKITNFGTSPKWG